MAREISPVCDFIFGSICMGLLMDMVDEELIIQMVKGIYICTEKTLWLNPWCSHHGVGL